MDPRPGSMVTPTVRLSRPLGAGATGCVWAADHLTLQTQVAVKLLYADVVRRDPTILQRFNREANVAAQLKSPHVIRTFDFGVIDDRTPFIVMELLEGESLAQRIERTGPLSVSDAGLVLRQAARALREAHGLGIVHRDIKPDNLFLVGSHAQEADQLDELFVKVLDFGIAKQTGAATGLTESDASFGTPRFMSPEQFLSTRDVDHQADLWALAAVAYKALTGRAPFEGDTIAAIAMAACRGKFVPPSQLRDSLPPALDAWFARAFDLDVGRRFGSASELTSAWLTASGQTSDAVTDLSADIDVKSMPGLRPAIAADSGAGTATLGPVWSARATGAARRPRWLGALVGLAVAGVAGAAVAYLSKHEQPPPQAASPPSATPPPAAPAEAAATEAIAAPPHVEPPPAGPLPASSGSVAGDGNAPPTPVATPARTQPRPAPAPSAPPPSCNPPFTVDAKGVRTFKVECL